MGRKMDVAEAGVSLVAKLAVTALWVVVAIAGFSVGQPILGIAAIAYVVYLWLFGGRWLIY